CTLRAARLLPTPSLTDYDTCFREKMSTNSSVDWGLPGAEFTALADCWCANNVSVAVEGYGCCGHNSFSRLCSLECNPDCSTDLAKQCIQDCPSMCLEASEYFVEANLCTRCSADTCFPVLKCLTAYAENLTKSGQLATQSRASAWWQDSAESAAPANVLSQVCLQPASVRRRARIDFLSFEVQCFASSWEELAISSVFIDGSTSHGSRFGIAASLARKHRGSVAFSLDREEADFTESTELKEYWDCWRNMPKHSSHWNVRLRAESDFASWNGGVSLQMQVGLN
ncbi:unnamed protein product, partial [Polarella glacialis]